MANFGAFAGGFSDGFMNGVRIGKTFQDILKQKKKEDFVANAKTEIGADYDSKYGPQAAAKTGMPGADTETQPVASSAPAALVTPSDTTDGAVPVVKSPTEAADAAPMKVSNVASDTPSAITPQATPVTGPDATPTMKTAAAGGIAPGAGIAPSPTAPAAAPKPDRIDYMTENMSKKMQQYYIEQGDAENAEKFGAYAESAKGRRAMKDWARAWTAPDFDGALDGFGRYYTDHIDDGVDYKSHEILTKSDGTQVGVITLQNKATGKESKVELTREKLLQLGGTYNPQALYQMETKRQETADKLKAEMTLKNADRKEKREEMVYKEDRADNREVMKNRGELSKLTLKSTLDAQNLGDKERATLDAKVKTLKDNGYTDDQIKEMVPSMIGADAHKKTTDPAERRALIQSDLIKNDPSWARKTEAERKEAVDQAMRINDVPAPASTGGRSASGKVSGAMMAPAGAKSGDVVTQNSTGAKFRVAADGSLVPMVPAAAGMPAR